MRSLFEYPNVVGTGLGFAVRGRERTDEPSRVVFVQRKVEAAALHPRDLVPPFWGELPTDVIEVGHIRALQKRTDRWVPAPGGVSIGHWAITAGTLGIVVKDALGGRVILSNNHVLANSNAAEIGDPIYQPGPLDGGTEMIARLQAFVPITFTDSPGVCPFAGAAASIANGLAHLLGSSHRLRAIQQDESANLVDAAIARPLSDDLVEEAILELPYPTKIDDAGLGDVIRKSGRTTGTTEGTVIAVDVTVDVDYGGKMGRFEHQFMGGPMSAGGDSGSACLSDGDLVGLLFAGSEQVTIFNPIREVFAALALHL
jgi:hypothetical protein